MNGFFLSFEPHLLATYMTTLDRQIRCCHIQFDTDNLTPVLAFMNQMGWPSFVVPRRAWRNIFLKKAKFGCGWLRMLAASFAFFHSCEGE